MISTSKEVQQVLEELHADRDHIEKLGERLHTAQNMIKAMEHIAHGSFFSEGVQEEKKDQSVVLYEDQEA